MRTSTATFRTNAFKTLRRQGVSSVKAKALVAKIVSDMRLRGNPVLPAGSFLMVDIRSIMEQRVVIVSDGLVIWLLETWDIGSLQPIVDCKPTARQLEIGQLLWEMTPDIYDALDTAGQDWDEANPRPATDETTALRRAATHADPAVVSLKARYDALVAESLAINPRVEAAVVDPEKASFWYEWVKETRGYRPDGFMTYAMVVADMARLETEKRVSMDDFSFDEAA